jgi:hypothetical protein
MTTDDLANQEENHEMEEGEEGADEEFPISLTVLIEKPVNKYRLSFKFLELRMYGIERYC